MRIPRRILLVTALLAMSAACMSEAVRAEASGRDSAIAAIDAAIQSLRHEPNQFHLQVNCIGVQATSNGGGTGLSVTAQGGGPGSQTTGMVVTTSGDQCVINQSAANEAVEQQAERAISLLTNIEEALQKPKVDEPTIISMLTEFGKTYVAPAVKSVIEVLIKRALHL